MPEHDATLHPMSRSTPFPDWVEVGAAAATLRSDWDRTNVGPTLTTVTRVGKRDVVLDNGERFNRSLRRDEGGVWGWTVALLPTDAPVVASATVHRARHQLRDCTLVACDEFRRGGLTAFDLILALAPLTGVEDEILALDTDASGRS